MYFSDEFISFFGFAHSFCDEGDGVHDFPVAVGTFANDDGVAEAPYHFHRIFINIVGENEKIRFGFHDETCGNVTAGRNGVTDVFHFAGDKGTHRVFGEDVHGHCVIGRYDAEEYGVKSQLGGNNPFRFMGNVDLISFIVGDGVAVRSYRRFRFRNAAAG